MPSIALSRRALLASGGAILVSFAAAPESEAAPAAAARPPLTPDQLDSFIGLDRHGVVQAYFGKIDVGQGIYVAIAQIVAEEMDLPLDHVRVLAGNTANSVNQGGASGSTGIQDGGRTLRYAAAEARLVLLQRAAKKLDLPLGQLAVVEGAVFDTINPKRRITYAQLAADGFFDTQLQWNHKYGNPLFSRGTAKPKNPKDYKIVGTSPPRPDIRANVFGDQTYVTDIRLPGMLHARMIRPPVPGAEAIAVDLASVKSLPGIQVVHEKGVVAVLAEKEWDAIRAMKALRVTWSDVPAPFPKQADIYDHIRNTSPEKHVDVVHTGDVAAALANGAQLLEAVYEWPFQSHASMGGACAVADVRPDHATLWTGSQKPHFAAQGLAEMLHLPADKMHAMWVRGPGSYGRNDAGDASYDATWLSQRSGRPVRVQYMRDQATGWDPKGPASVHFVRAALDKSGHISGYSFLSKGFSRMDVPPSEAEVQATLLGQMLGLGTHHLIAFAVPTEPYEYGAALLSWEVIPALLAAGSPLRTSHLRDPVGPQINFASESFIDELAAAAGADPVAFRLKHLSNPRAIAVVKAAAEKFGWKPRPAASTRTKGASLVGRGFSFALRGKTLIAAAVEVEVDRASGAVLPTRWSIAHDCGLIVNPDTLRRTIEGNILHGTSRALMEEVHFTPTQVTSVDWLTYPILDIIQIPTKVDITLINHPDQPATGAGEPSSRPIASAIANAIFDATGVRLRRAPFTPERVKAALA